MKRFYSLNPKHLEGLGFWFWFRENWAFINNESVRIATDYWEDPPGVWRFREWFYLFLVPFAYILAFFIGPYYRKKEAFRYARPDWEVTFFNKKNIEYLTILHTLSGNYDSDNATIE